MLNQAEVVLVSLLGGASYWNYGFERLQAWQKAKPERQLILVPGDDAQDPELTLASSCAPASVSLCAWLLSTELVYAPGSWTSASASGRGRG